jgi:hypothetical protein
MTLPDPDGVGQAVVAIVQLVSAERDMERYYEDAHRPLPTNVKFRARKMKLYIQAKNKRDEALRVLDALGVPKDRRTIWPVTTCHVTPSLPLWHN